MTRPPGLFKTSIATNAIDYVLSVDKFEHQFVVLKGMLQPPRLKYHVHTIGIHSSLSNNAMYEHKCLQNIKKIYKQAGKCDGKQQFKDILEADMVSTHKGLNNNSPISPMISTLLKKSRAKKSLYLFTYILDLKHISTR